MDKELRNSFLFSPLKTNKYSLKEHKLDYTFI
jgi:hypothetical protein